MGKNKIDEENKANKNLVEDAQQYENSTPVEDNENVTEMHSQAEELLKNLKDEQDKYLRLLAEYDNFRKRTAKERLDLFSDATAKAVTDILPVYDNFERAMAVPSQDENYQKGMSMIFNMFGEALKKLGVTIIDPLGQEFNPNEAQAINQKEDENFGENTVCEVFQKGYKLADKVIRYAMVVVANP